jgi:AcrR family transcriptional regulator
MNPLMPREVVSLRDSHVEATRGRIVDAVSALLSEEHPATLSVPAVARRAGVSVATVYRYFPSKEQLLDAAADVGELGPLDGATRPIPADRLDDALREQFRHLAGMLPLIHAQLASPAGREIRSRRLSRRRRQADRSLELAGVDPGTPEGQRLARVGLLLASSVALVELHERQGVPVDDVAADMAWAARVLTQATRREQRAGRRRNGDHDTTTEEPR